MRARTFWWSFLALLALAGSALVWLGDDAGASNSAGSASAPVAPATLIARGAYLARIGNCGHCHTAPGGGAFAGGRAIDTPFGPVYSSNLTPDRERGLGAWSADDFWRALHHGISKDQRLLNPAFPYTSFTRVTRSDADALFAYLQSLPPATTLNKPAALSWPYDSQWALRIWRKLYFTPFTEADTARTDPAHSAQWQRGAYLVQGLGHCLECHAARNALGAINSAVGARGGVLPITQWYAPALGDTSEASVAHWSQDATVHFLTTGVSPNGFATGPMAEVVLHGTQYLQTQDATAMALYLQTPELFARNTEAAASGVIAHAAEPGLKLYGKFCADCHGDQGQGQPGAYPALAGNRNVTMDNTNNLVQVVLHGGFAPATQGNPRPYGMPPFMLQLNDEEVAQVLSHIRTAWGNQASAVSEFDISRLRRAQSH